MAPYLKKKQLLLWFTLIFLLNRAAGHIKVATLQNKNGVVLLEGKGRHFNDLHHNAKNVPSGTI